MKHSKCKITFSSKQSSDAFHFFRTIVALICTLMSNAAHAALPPAEAINLLTVGQSVDLIIEYEATTIEKDADSLRLKRKLEADDDAILIYKARRYKGLKDSVDFTVANPDIEQLTDYSHLPLSFKRFHSLASLNTLMARPDIKAVYLNDAFHAVLAQSLPLINQPIVSSVGVKGLGTTVAVIDNGIDFTNAVFGSCTAPGVPVGCHVSVSLNFGTGTTNNLHGTNVSAIVLGVAPDSQIAMLNAFSGTSAFTADIISAINWAISNKSIYNIVAINMSLGDGTINTTPCATGNAFSTPVTNAVNAGIAIVAAAGNDAFTNALNKPACTPSIISVGAVYDSDLTNQGYPGIAWGTLCTDTTTASDKVTCFSDSANYLTMLAPGALITAAGIMEGGTSQASPHVTGAIAVLRSAFPLETLIQIKTRLTSSGTMVTDPRNGVSKPRLNLLEASRPANDAFSNRFALNGNSGSANGISLLATKETGEPVHANNSGGHSVWWKLIPVATGQLSLDTHGSGFDTLLAAYTGKSVGSLTSIVSNDNDGSVNSTSSMVLQVQLGKEYEFAIDGVNSASGTIAINWNLNTTAAANLSISLTGSPTGAIGNISTYSATIINTGPQTATQVLATAILPVGSSFVPGTNACTVTGNTVKCDLGETQNGTQVLMPLQLLWNTANASANITASVTSDLPDPVIANNNSAIQIVVGTVNTTDIGNDNTDVPTLPQWGVLLLAMSLSVIATKR
jgi:uncharacterized repeat protein (TIGR01451 family)